MTTEEKRDLQNKALRTPQELFGTTYTNAAIDQNTLLYHADNGFTEVINKLKITLLASREYENLLLSFHVNDSGKLEQHFIHLPHPSGIAFDQSTQSVYVAATRNPNQIIELKAINGFRNRLTVEQPAYHPYLIPVRAKYYPGEYYFHDLVWGDGVLYANSVGMNSIIAINMNSPLPEEPVWHPLCIEKEGKPLIDANYIQLNSIAWGGSLEQSFFSASGCQIGDKRPGHPEYEVDGTGVIFSGATRAPIAYGLTRPHAARLHNGQIWVANSGYGQVGYIDDASFIPVHTFNGWTRGLCFVSHYLFVGLSRVLPRFRQYAPGIKSLEQTCAIVAINLQTNQIAGTVTFPDGNQIFAIEAFFQPQNAQLPYSSTDQSGAINNIFSVYRV